MKSFAARDKVNQLMGRNVIYGTTPHLPWPIAWGNIRVSPNLISLVDADLLGEEPDQPLILITPAAFPVGAALPRVRRCPIDYVKGESVQGAGGSAGSSEVAVEGSQPQSPPAHASGEPGEQGSSP